MKLCLVLLVLLIFSANSLNFDDWKNQFEKNYNESEKEKAREAYNNNIENITKHNNNPNATYYQEPNAAADLNITERDQLRGFIPDDDDENDEIPEKSLQSGSSKDSTPKSLSYIKQVTVRDF